MSETATHEETTSTRTLTSWWWQMSHCNNSIKQHFIHIRYDQVQTYVRSSFWAFHRRRMKTRRKVDMVMGRDEFRRSQWMIARNERETTAASFLSPMPDIALPNALRLCRSLFLSRPSCTFESTHFPRWLKGSDYAKRKRSQREASLRIMESNVVRLRYWFGWKILGQSSFVSLLGKVGKMLRLAQLYHVLLTKANSRAVYVFLEFRKR